MQFFMPFVFSQDYSHDFLEINMLSQLYEDNFEFVKNICARFVRNGMSEEIAQDVFVAMLERGVHIASKQELYWMARDRCCNRVLRLKRVQNEIPFETLPELIYEPNIDARLDLYFITKRLSDKQKQIFYLRYLEDLSPQETATKMKLKIQYIRNALCEIKKQLRTEQKSDYEKLDVRIKKWILEKNIFVSKQLIETFGISKATASRHLSKLQKANLIKIINKSKEGFCETFTYKVVNGTN